MKTRRPDAADAVDKSAAPVNIGEAARRSGVTPKMVRHYENLGLLPPVMRTDSGYRQYGERDIHTLRFIRRSRDLGFSMAEIADLLGLWQDQQRASAQVRQIATQHIADLGRRIAALDAMKKTLEQLVDCCHGNDRPDCPILDDLAGASDQSTLSPRFSQHHQ